MLGCCTAVWLILWQERFRPHGTAATAASEPDTARDSLSCMWWPSMASCQRRGRKTCDASTAPSSSSGSPTCWSTRPHAWSRYNTLWIRTSRRRRSYAIVITVLFLFSFLKSDFWPFMNKKYTSFPRFWSWYTGTIGSALDITNDLDCF